MLNIAIQGEKGSNHHLLVEKLLVGVEFELLPEKSFPEVANSVNTGAAQLGVMAIENSIAGSILANYDLLSNNNFTVIAEGYLRIEHCLIGIQSSKLEDIKVVYSHEMALRQCTKFINQHNLEAREYFDTAAAVNFINSQSDKSEAAIAPAIAAEVYKGEILAKGIETNKSNFTRFIVISKPETVNKNSELFPKSTKTTKATESKAMVEFTVSHIKGSLLTVLQSFADLGYNLTKIESRPIVGDSWHYKFYVDFLTTKSPGEIKTDLDSLLGKQLEYLRLHGIFPSGETFEP